MLTQLWTKTNNKQNPNFFAQKSKLGRGLSASIQTCIWLSSGLAGDSGGERPKHLEEKNLGKGDYQVMIR